MDKNIFLKSTIILLLGTFITKIFGFIIRIIYTRIIGPDGISLYSLILPTYSLILVISSFSMPISISKLISLNKYRSRDIMVQGVFIILIINFIFMFLLIFFSGFIANSLLHEKNTKILLIGLSLSMPNMGLACIFKGYFYGKQNMIPNTISNIVEQTIRILFVIFILPYFIKKSIVIGVLSFILVNIVTEASSIITFLLILPKNTKLHLSSIKFNYDISLDLFNTSFPLVSSKIIGSIGYFLEPIVLSNILLFVGYDSSFFIKEYGIYNGYAMSLLLLPSFLITALSTSLVPEISKNYASNNIILVKKRLRQSIVISFAFGLVTSLLILFNTSYLLKLIYNTNLGINYTKILCIIFPMYYLEAPLSSFLQALGNSKYIFRVSLLATILKLLFTTLFSLFRIGLYGLIISEGINILLIVYLNYKRVKKILK